MDDLIKKVTDTLGLDENVVRKAIGSVLAFFKSHVGDDFDFGAISRNLQGVDSLIREADEPLPPESQPKESSTLVGGIIALIKWVLTLGPVVDILKKFLETLFGQNATRMIESAEEGVELAGVMNKLGISTEQGHKMISMLMDFMKQKVDPKTMDQLTEQVPALKSFMDDAKKDD